MIGKIIKKYEYLVGTLCHAFYDVENSTNCIGKYVVLYIAPFNP